MKRLALVPLVVFCFALALAGPGHGQYQVYHDSSNSTGGVSNTFPFGNAFGNNWRYQFSVPASSLPAKPVRFVGVAFAPVVNGVFSVKDFQLRIGHSASAALTSIFATNLGIAIKHNYLTL